MRYNTPLARARGLGSAKSGTLHWWLQRVTAVALIPLSMLLLPLFSTCLHASYQDTVTWLAMPLHSIGLIAWIITVFYHAALGLQVVIEDYIAQEGLKIISVWFINLIFCLLGLTALLALLRIVLR